MNSEDIEEAEFYTLPSDAPLNPEFRDQFSARKCYKNYHVTVSIPDEYMPYVKSFIWPANFTPPAHVLEWYVGVVIRCVWEFNSFLILIAAQGS